MDGENLRLLQSLDQPIQDHLIDSLDGQFQPIGFSLGLLQTLVIQVLVQFLLLLFLLQFPLMVVARDVRAGIEIAVSLPDLQANPAELVLASAGHVDAPIVLLDGLATHGALLHHEAVDPLVLPPADQGGPAAQVQAFEGPVGLAAAVATDLSPAFAGEDRVDDGLGVYEEGLPAGLVGTETGIQALLTVL